jgi:hypothetical protein
MTVDFMRSSPIILLLITATARAQTPDPDYDPNQGEDGVPAVTDTFELQIGGGYVVGAGDVAGSLSSSIGQLTDGGGQWELSLGYRASPYGAFGVFGTVGGFARGNALPATTDVLVASAGLFTQIHLAPGSDLDPWIGLGTGWRMLALDDPSSTSTIYHGIELGRLQLGFDLRSAPEVAIAPVVTAGLDMFLWQDTPDRGIQELRDPRLSAFVSVGLQLRIDANPRLVRN